MVQLSTWTQCYQDSWNGLICPEAFSHPAKFSKALIFRIVQHVLDEGWLAPGSICLDPFGGVGLGGLPCLLHGLQYVGVELEDRFVTLGNANLALWARKYGHLPQYKAPMLVQGDSRHLAQVLGQAEVCVSSPPFVDRVHASGNIQSREQREAQAHKRLGAGQINDARDYGDHPHNLGNLPPGSLDACLSSPPYIDNLQRKGDDAPGSGGRRNGQGGSHGGAIPARYYGTHPAQLGQMAPGQVEAIVASPPFMYTHAGHTSDLDVGHKGLKYSDESPQDHTTGGDRTSPHAIAARKSRAEGIANLAQIVQVGNGGNLVNVDTFWSAARTILEQVFQVLKPGGVAIWVLKSYCRDGAIVDFPHQWESLCHSVGFTTLHEHQALLVEEHGVQGGLFGEDTTHRTERKSFFRRLHEKKRPDLAIDHETVLCMRKPATVEQGPPDEAGAQEPLVDACVASPPYAESNQNYAQGWSFIDLTKCVHQRHTVQMESSYGTTPGQLGAMPPGSVEACIASPPYADRCSNDNQRTLTREGLRQGHNEGDGVTYGDHPAQLGNMPAGTPPKDPAC